MATERRKEHVRRSLRGMETEANDLVAFLESVRDRRRTIGIVVNSGDSQHHITINTDEIPNDNSLIRINSKGSVYSSGRCSPSPSVASSTRSSRWCNSSEPDVQQGQMGEVVEDEVDTQTKLWEAHRERRRRKTNESRSGVAREVVEEAEESKICQITRRLEQAKTSSPPPIPPRIIYKPKPVCPPKPRQRLIPSPPTTPLTQPSYPTPPALDGERDTDVHLEEDLVDQSEESPECENKADTSENDSDPDSGISGEVTDLSQLHFNLHDIDELDDLANDLTPIALDCPEIPIMPIDQKQPEPQPELVSFCRKSSFEVETDERYHDQETLPYDYHNSKVDEVNPEAPEPQPAQEEITQMPSEQTQVWEQDEVEVQAHPDQNQTFKDDPSVDETNIGSLNSRMNRYQSKAENSPEIKRTETMPKVSTIDKFKDNYLKQTEKPVGGLQSETPVSGALSLKERMKMFEAQSSKSVQREVVGQGERAANIRSKITNWGVTGDNSSTQQRERITVVPLSERRTQYNAVANAQ